MTDSANRNPANGRTAVPTLALSAEGSGTMFGVSRAQWWKLHSSGRIPQPVGLGSKAPRWRVDELRAWLDAGCPDRQTWQRMRGGER